MTSLPDLDMVVFDILGTMVDEPSGIRRGLQALLPDIDDARTRSASRCGNAHVDEQQGEILAGRRPYASSTAIDLEAATRVAAEADVSDADAVRSLAASAQRLEPWRDSVPALTRIAARFPVVGLSNASHWALTRINAHAGLRWHQALSAEDCAQLQASCRRLPPRDHQRGLLARPPAHGRRTCLGPSRCPGGRHEDGVRRTSRGRPSERGGLVRPVRRESR